MCGAIFSSPLMAIPAHVSPWLLRLSQVLGTVTPGLPVDRLNSAGIARDVEVVRAYDADPQVYHGPIRARTGAELARAIEALPALLPRIDVPFLVFHGTADTVAPMAGSQMLFEGAASADKEHFFVESGFHELLNDVGREDVIAKVLGWAARHGATASFHRDDGDGS
jgi:alpha-beta hydrolase superfamily lysophospholipase